MSGIPLRPWQRPPQFQHGHHDEAFGDAESTGALLARLAAAREWEDRSASPTRQRPWSSTAVGVLFDWTHDARVEYLDLLDHVLEDHVITAAEVARLKEVAALYGIGALEAACLHRGYIGRAWARACADATVTPAELRDIEMLAELLGVPLEVRHRDARGGAEARWVAVPIGADTVASGPAPWSAPIPSSEEVGKGAAAEQGDVVVARPSQTHERR